MIPQFVWSDTLFDVLYDTTIFCSQSRLDSYLYLSSVSYVYWTVHHLDS